MLHVLSKQSICLFCNSQIQRYCRHLNIGKNIRMEETAPIFRSIVNVIDCLKKFENEFTGVPELLNIYHQKKDIQAKNNSSDSKKFPLIILEGLDGCGKTSVGRRLAAKLGAQQWKTPPESIGHLRQSFDAHVELRTAYYSLGNYIAAIEVQDLLKSTPVVMDRYWHSTAAYGIAQAVQDKPDKYKLPLQSDKIFYWPEDLLKPDIVIFLDVSEAVRKERQSRRRNITMQEGLLNKSEDFRKNVIQAYKNMQNPGVVFINGDLSFERNLAQIEEKTKHLFRR